MDYSQFRRSTNVEDNRASGLAAMWNEIRPADAMTWEDLKLGLEHPLTPISKLKKEKQGPLPSPVLPAPQGSLEGQAGINALPNPAWRPDEARGGKGDREDRVAPQFFAGAAPTAAPTATPTVTPKGGGMRPEVVDAVTRAANEAGEDPAFALAVAERESNGNPNAHSSKSIYGIFQMTGNLRHQYGVGDSSDPYTQAQGWTRFIGDTRQDMTNRLGREPTNEELYLGHHFGPDRAAAMLNGRIPGSMSTSDVFSPYEMSINPHFGRAGTVGNLTSSITGDIAAREARYGGATGHEPPDFAEFGQPVGFTQDTAKPLAKTGTETAPQPIDFAQFGTPVGLKVNKGEVGEVSPNPTQPQLDQMSSPDAAPTGIAPGSRPGTEVDLSQYGLTPGGI
jgi:hypothetical protein